MSCNCNSGDTPEYYITLDGVGADGYSPEINIINEDTKSFELELVNKNNTQITSAIPKLTYLEGTYVSNSSLASTLASYSTTAQITATYLSKSDAATTYLKVDGSNANNPITIDGLQIRNNSGYITLGTGTTTTINTQARAINFVETDSNGDQQSLIQMGSTGSINVRAAGTLTLGGSGTRPGYSQSGGSAKSLALLTDIPDITTKLNTNGSNASNPITIDGHTFESLYGGLNTKLTMTGSPAYIEAPALVLRSTDTGKVYYKSSNVNNELATIGDINDATITITQGGVTKGTFTLNQSGNATIALDAGGSASTNPIVLKTTDESRSLALGLDNDTKKAYMTYTISTGGMNLPLPVRLIAGKSAPITLTETNEGLTTIGLDYDTNSLDVDINNKLVVDSDYIEAHKAYLANGDTLTDPQGLEDVEYYNHSSFDLSKFTIVGSPTITDGVVSGFSDLNYIRIPIPDLSTANTWEIDGKFKLSALNTSNGSYVFSSSSGNSVLLVGISSSNHLTINLGNSAGSGWQTSEQATASTQTLSTNTDYYYKFIFTGTAYQLFISTDNDTFIKYCEFISSTKIGYNSNWNFTLGNSRNPNASSALKGTIDLKQFSITVNGQEVFSGNKTGVDTIKPDDYTVVGTPTISADGIASGFSSSNYITKAIPLNTKWKFIFKNKYATASTAQTPLSIVNSVNNKVIVRLWNRANSPNCQIVPYRDNNTFTAITFNCINNHEYEYIVWNDGTNINYQVKDLTDNSTVVEGVQSLGDYSIGSISANIFLGVNSSNSEAFTGSIDLNAFKIYVDGNLVYQPCLKIPYTLSKMGSKIVQSVYRDRVTDMYEQFGYAPYYILDKTNGNFTLPMGEIYGYMTRLEGIVKDLQTRLAALESNINAGGAGVVQQGLLGMSPLSFGRPQLLGEFNPEDEMDIEPIEEDIQEEELEPQETEEEPIEETVEEQEEPQEEGGEDE